MSITSAMFTGVSGLLNNGEAINVIGNNIANVSTTGFKSSRTLFADMLYSNIGNSSQVGRGMIMQKVDNLFSNGSTQNTSSVTDLALQGGGFFAVKAPTTASPVASQSAALLTRAGSFHVDKDTYLVNPDGYQVLDTQGNPIKFSDNSTAIDAAASTFQADASIAAQQTALATDIAAAATAAGGTPPASYTALLPSVTAAKTALDDAITNLGVGKTGANAQAVLSAFNSTLALVKSLAATVSSAVTANISAVTTAYQPVSAEMGKAFSKVARIDPDGLITYLGKDGVTNLYYNTSGAVGVAATTANATLVQRLAIVSPVDPGALEKAGGNIYKPTTAAGISNAAFSLASNTPNGTSDKVLSNTLEQSNVDMATEFVNLIMTQRAYSANSKTITTADEMTQEVLNLKR